MRKHLLLIIADVLVILASMILAHWLVFSTVADTNMVTVAVIAAEIIVCFAIAGVYRVRINNSSLGLVFRIAVGFLPITFVNFLIAGFTQGFNSQEFRYTITQSAISMFVLLGYRVLFRIVLEMTGADDKKPRAVVYGAGELGTTMARQCQRGKFDYRIVGFVDDDPGLNNEIIVNYPVLGKLENLERVLEKTRVKYLIVAITNINAEKIQQVMEVAKKRNVNVKIVPNLFEMSSSHEPMIRDIRIEDLLGRQLNTIEKEPLFEMFGNKTVLVTGAGGSIGSEICNQLMEYGLKKLVILDIDETELHDQALRLLGYEHEWSDKVVPVVCDIKNAKKVQRIFAEHKPDIVFHAAAYKHVPLMELFPEEAINTNICGSFNVFKAAADNKVKRVVVISTDKAVNPTNIMGATKRIVEMMSASFDKETKTEYCCVRFGNVIGSRGSMLPLFLEQIKAGKPITVTDRRIIRYFMAIPEAVSLVFKAATIAKGGEVMVLDMGEPVNIYDFAQRLIKLYGDERNTIKVTGLRPGEKLYEELLAQKDNTIPTTDKKIFKAKVRQKTSFTLEHLSEIVESIPTMEPEELVKQLEATVPEFHRGG